jgi:stage V sporulation protein SpoVS
MGLVSLFAVEAPSESQASIKGEKLASAIDADPVAQFLLNTGRVKRTERDGRLHITCPFEGEHTGDSGETSTTYWPAHTGGYAQGHFRCLHAHCEHRSDQDFRDAVGYVDEDLMSEFSAIAGDSDAPQPITDKAEVLIDTAPVAKPARFQVMTAAQFAVGKPLTWLIKGVLPRAEMGMVYGESTAGKTFAVLDMVAHVALGRPWRGLITRQVRVVYVIAEGVAGMRYRLRATAQAMGLELEQLPIKFIADAPNLLEKADALAIAKAIVAAGGADLVVLDTFAQVMAGGNENSGEDVGKVLSHCRGISKALGGAMVLPVHHSGKDTSRGARGWSGIKAAMDVELEVVAVEDRRSITVTKLKDGPGQGREYGFRLETVVLGLDEDGEEITSCVVHATDGQVRKVAQAKLGEYERAVLDAVEESAGVANTAVDLELVIQAAVSKVPFVGGGEDRRRDNVKRAAANLCDKKGLLVRDGVGLRLKSQISAG